jgi:hypothetical protein
MATVASRSFCALRTCARRGSIVAEDGISAIPCAFKALLRRYGWMGESALSCCCGSAIREAQIRDSEPRHHPIKHSRVKWLKSGEKKGLTVI